MASSIIESRENKLYKYVKQLQQKKYRQRFQHFLIEDSNVIEECSTIQELIISSDKVDRFKKLLKSYAGKVTLFSPELFKSVSQLEHSKGVIAIVPMSFGKTLTASTCFILEEIQDPGNMGTILRTLDALGFYQVIVTPGCVDIWNEKTVRSAMGSLLHMEIFVMSVEEILTWSEKEKVTLFATTLSNRSIEHYELSSHLGEKNGFIMGNEGQGVSKQILENAHKHIKIAMYGRAESLNVGVATAVMGYEVRRWLKL